ncbi:hypothetical protein ETD86_47030 [Nonomuraea turkmeniaca]|uniref:Glycosyltransferase family 2 protein n=1 Tax=Nonomuraea turkmeniaca TaxID=103838 RepID=A0A5S4EY26_9ACTN|nr:hypothetical protein [Nonomuraea turkmeniaca]TMR08602.1 hypothetical protein ETD86_47030 [Nonomuraea turkmeniaca]
METEIATVRTEHHHGSHRHLADVYDDGPAGGEPGNVDAIVVPTIRHPAWLKHAIRLASELGCPLVTLHSRKWSKPELAALLMPSDVQFIAIDIGNPASLSLPDFRTTAVLKNTPFARVTDLSAKRNIGLLLARLMDWERIVFLDDDIEVGSKEEVARAAALLDDYDAVGMHIGGYPDNSVVCHAHRLTGGDQDSFVGGGALAVETTRNPSFFPNIYNEDWFYLLDETSLRRLAVTGKVKQRPYDPFDRHIRARDQELGDVLAEGVYWLLDGEKGTGWAAATDPAYWTGFLAQRKAFINDVLRRVKRLPPGSVANRDAMQESLEAALGRHHRIDEALCVSYIEAWSEDRRTWAAHFAGTPQLKSTADAMKWLVKDGAPQLRWWTSMA